MSIKKYVVFCIAHFLELYKYVPGKQFSYDQLQQDLRMTKYASNAHWDGINYPQIKLQRDVKNPKIRIFNYKKYIAKVIAKTYSHAESYGRKMYFLKYLKISFWWCKFAQNGEL